MVSRLQGLDARHWPPGEFQWVVTLWADKQCASPKQRTRTDCAARSEECPGHPGHSEHGRRPSNSRWLTATPLWNFNHQPMEHFSCRWAFIRAPISRKTEKGSPAKHIKRICYPMESRLLIEQASGCPLHSLMATCSCGKFARVWPGVFCCCANKVQMIKFPILNGWALQNITEWLKFKSNINWVIITDWKSFHRSFYFN